MELSCYWTIRKLAETLQINRMRKSYRRKRGMEAAKQIEQLFKDRCESLIAALNVREDDVCYAAFTGKAAQVLLKKGNKNVSTLHRLFKSFPKPDGTFYSKVSSIPYKIVIEVSMAPKSLMILFSFKNVHIICLGDPFQLPPVDANEDNHLLDNPHIFLDEVMRQAQESEIIRVTMDIRQGKPLLICKVKR